MRNHMIKWRPSSTSYSHRWPRVGGGGCPNTGVAVGWGGNRMQLRGGPGRGVAGEGVQP